MRIISSLRHRWRAEGGYRQVLAMAVPLVLSTGSWSLQGFINRMFLVWHSPESLAAAMPAGMVNFAIMSIFTTTAGYVSTFAAQYHGAGQNERVGGSLWQAAPIALFAGIVNLALIPASAFFFRWVGHDPAVQVEEVAFFRILCLGGFPAVMSAAFSGMLSGLGRTRPVMVVTLLTTSINILLDWLLIFGHLGFPALGISGAGWASISAGIVQLLAYAVIVFRRTYRERFRTLDVRPRRKEFLSLLRYGLPSGVQFFIDMAGFTIFILLVGRLGRNELAATNLAFNVNTVAFMPMLGIGITMAYMATIAVLFLLLPRVFLRPFAAASDPRTFPAIANLTVVLLKFVAVYTLFDALNIIFSSAIKGAGDTRFVMWMLICVSFGVLVIPSFIAIRYLSATIYACWGLATAYVIILGFSFFLRYRQGKWASMRVIETPATPSSSS
jgi:MATE family multidrug resistance protein